MLERFNGENFRINVYTPGIETFIGGVYSLERRCTCYKFMSQIKSFEFLRREIFN